MPRKKTFEEVAAAFSEVGWAVTSQEYGGAHAPLRAICPNGHEKTTQYHILAIGNLICKQCVKLDRMNRTCCMCRNKVPFASKIEKHRYKSHNRSFGTLSRKKITISYRSYFSIGSF
jgi:vesicle coat complex subunit